MSWTEWQSVRGRRAKRRSLPQSQDAVEENDDDDVQATETVSGVLRSQPVEKVHLDRAWLRGTREFFKYPPQWKIEVENTFISVHSWHDRSLRTTLSAPACLVTADSSCATGSSSSTSTRSMFKSAQQNREKAKGNPAEVGAGVPKIVGRLPADFPAPPTWKPPAPPPAMAEEAEDSPSSSTMAVRAADEAAGPKRRKPKSKPKGTTAKEALSPKPHAVSTPPVAHPKPAPEMSDFGMITVVRGRRRRELGRKSLQHLDADTGTSAEADDEDASSVGQTSSIQCHIRDADDILLASKSKCDTNMDDDSHGLSASPSLDDLHKSVEAELHEEDEAKESANEAVDRHTHAIESASIEAEIPSPSMAVSSPSSKNARRQRKRAAKAAAKANLVSAKVATPRSDCRVAVAAQLGSGRDLCTELRGLARRSWPSSRPCAERTGALQRRQARRSPSVEAEMQARLQQVGAALDFSADSQPQETSAFASSARGDSDSDIFELESDDSNEWQQKENCAELSPANAATAAKAFSVDRGVSFSTCGFVGAGDAAAGNGLFIDHVGKASPSIDSGDIGRVIAALVREKNLNGMPGGARGQSSN